MSSQYFLKRAGRAVLTIWIAITLTFGMIRLLPGGPLVQLRGQLIRAGVPANQVNAIIANYQNIRPDEPLYIQYIDYVISLLQGDLGRSIQYDQSVTSIIAEALPWTILVMVTATILMFGIGIVLGGIMAYKEGSTFDSVTSTVSILLSSVPFYVLAIVFVYILGYQLSWFPTGDRIAPGVETGLTIEFISSAIYHAILPITSVVITEMGVQALVMRGNSIQVLGEDFVRVARLRGLSDSRISSRYVGRNAILPMYTAFLTGIGFNLGGSVILEQVFSYPGVGWYMFQALEMRDYPLMMGVFLVITIVLVLAVFIADLTYGLIDPRVSSGGTNEAF